MDSEGLRRSRTLLRMAAWLAAACRSPAARSVPLGALSPSSVSGSDEAAHCGWPTGSVLAAAAHAQTATACATASSELAQQTALTTLLQPFTTLPGTAAWTANYETQQSIYLNSTYA